MNTTYKIKIAARYIVLCFFMYLGYDVTRPSWILDIKEIDPMTLNVIYGSVFGSLTWIIKSHFETKPSDEFKVPEIKPGKDS